MPWVSYWVASIVLTWQVLRCDELPHWGRVGALPATAVPETGRTSGKSAHLQLQRRQMLRLLLRLQLLRRLRRSGRSLQSHHAVIGFVRAEKKKN